MKIVCIDFDGTIVEKQYPKIGKLAPKAIEWLHKFNEENIKIILWTIRSGKELNEAVDFLKFHGVKLYGINKNPAQKSWSSSPKAYCNYYIDDSNIGIPMIKPSGFEKEVVDWDKVGSIVMKKIF